MPESKVYTNDFAINLCQVLLPEIGVAWHGTTTWGEDDPTAMLMCNYIITLSEETQTRLLKYNSMSQAANNQ